MEAIATGAAANVSSESAKGIFHEVKRHIRYVIIYKKNVEKFEEKLGMLIAKRASVQQDVGVAERNGEKIKADVQDWCDRVDKVITKEEKKVNDLEDKAKNKCFFGLCPNIKSRHQLSRKAEEDAAAFDDLISKCQFNGVGYRDIPEVIGRKDFETFKSREKVFNDIMESLKDATISMIGVYGMAGVGKTSLVKEVAVQVQDQEIKLFDSVVWAMVSPTPDIQKIQDQIAECTGLNLEEKSLVARARRLCERLKKEKKLLIILDDIWKKLDLEEVGIPFGSQHKGCKILLTSRNQQLCNEMDATKTFPIGALDDEETWKFFKKMAGDGVESAELRPTAIEVAKKCAGLPLAIATVARALRPKDTFAWRDALRQLQRLSEDSTEISAAVYSAIKLSYNHLRSEELQQIFLLCSLLRRVARIDDLLRYAIGVGLIKGVKTLQEARDRLLTILSELKDFCLLLDSNTNEQYFDMHDLTYIVAKSIAFKDNQVFALNEDDGLTDWPDGETMKKCTQICLLYPSISKLPNELNCPHLLFFLMSSKDFSLTLSDNFFKEATNLKVLDLTGMHFSSLPSSIRLLTSLCTLCLFECELGDIAIIGELKNLEILTIWKCNIRFLPKEIGQLVKLKLLDLSHCTKLKTIPPGVLSSLSRLEELYMGDTFIQWEVERLPHGRSNASLAELQTLSRLSTLEVHIPDSKAVRGDLFFEVLQKLERYKIFIGKEWEWFGNYDYSRTLKLRLSTSIDHLDRGIKMLLKKTEDLYLDDLKGVKIALQELNDGESLPELKKLHIQNGSDIEYIINDNDAADKNGFLQLKSLTLEGLPQLISFCPPQHNIDANSTPQHELPLFQGEMLFPSLENLRLSSSNVSRIWHNQLSNTSFCTHEKLTTLIIQDCGNLKQLLSFSMARCLLHLKYFEIVGCKCLREIIFTRDIEEETQVMTLFPQLIYLELRDLQDLIGFCSNSETLVIEFSSMKSLKIDSCPKLEGFIYRSTMEGNQRLSHQALFDNKVAFPSLVTMKISYLRNMKMIWQNPLPANSFPKLQNMEVEGCDQLSTIFPSNMLTTFQRLQILVVKICISLEAVFEVESFTDGLEEEGITQTYLLPQLQMLELSKLPRLGGFCRGDNSKIDAPALFNEKVVFPSLNFLAIVGVGNCRKIWHDKVPIGSFSKLKFLVVDKCERLLNIFPSNTVERLEKLETLKIWRCESLEEIIAPVDHRQNSKESQAVTATELIEAKSLAKFVFPKIRLLELWMLPKLKGFYSKMHTTKWPSLKQLFVVECNKVETFAGEYHNFREAQGESQRIISVQQPLFWVNEETFPNLEELDLSQNDIMKEIWHGALPKQYFCNLRSLELTSFPKTSVAIPNCFIQSLPNLERLSVKKAAFNEIFPCEGLGDEDEHAGTLAHLKELRLSELPELTHLWKKELSFGEVFYNLEILEALGCGKLKDLVPSFVSFKNLTTLEVSKCHGFKNLVTFRMAKSMVQLTRMSISDCQMIEEIIASTTDEVTDGIVFSQLKSLKLDCLPSLSRFNSGNYTLVFPSLEEVIMRQCSKMEFFTNGELSTPMLQGIQSTKGEHIGLWEGDLNTIIQQLFMEKVFPSLEDLEQSSINIQRTWNHKLLATHSYAQNLTCLTIEGCHNFNSLFSSSMVKSFVQLKKLNIENCENVENVIFVEGLAKEEMMSLKLFRALEFLLLKDLPNLTRFCHGNYFEFPLLRILRIESCPTLKTFISDAEGNNSGMTSPTLFDEKVAFSCLEDLSIIGVGNWRKIWHNQSTNCPGIRFANC